MKYKYLTIDELVINLDRLSRFKNPEESYPRVFTEIISKCLIHPKYSKTELLKLDVKTMSNIVLKIWNSSVKQYFKTSKYSTSNILKLLIKNTFKNLDKHTETLINTKLNILPILENINYDKAPLNLKFLIKASKYETLTIDSLIEIREKYNLKFPIKKLLIVEGITEEILLPVFADKLDMNFDQNGIYILGAGGKSKSPSLYLKLKDKLKIPVVLLFDSDAEEISNKMNEVLLKKDSTIIIKQGEFEDILSKNLIKRALNNEYKPATPILLEDLKQFPKMCDNIELFYKLRHLGEFKKAKLSKIIAENIKYDTDISPEIKNIIMSLV